MNVIKNYKFKDQTLPNTKQRLHLRTGFLSLGGIVIVSFFLIPAGVTGLLFGSYGIFRSLYDSMHHLSDTELLHEIQVAINHVDKQFGFALEIVKESKRQANAISELTLEQLAKTLSCEDGIDEQHNQIKQAADALQDYSCLLKKRIDQGQKKRRGKKQISQKLINAMNNVLSHINKLLPEIHNLNKLIAKHASYFNAYEIEWGFSSYYNKLLLYDTHKESIKLQKKLHLDIKNLAKIHSGIISYPNLQQRLDILDQHLKTIQEHFEMALV